MYAKLIILISALVVSGVANSDESLAEMQRQLNQETVSKPFDPGNVAKVDAYIAEAMKKNIKPEVQKAPSYWQQGYTCRDAYRYGGYRAYRNCRYYRHYHGRYWW